MAIFGISIYPMAIFDKTPSMMIVLNTLVTTEVHVVQVLKHVYTHVQSFKVALYYHILDVYKPR